MDIKEVASRAVTTLPLPKWANMSPGLQTDPQKISSRLSETATTPQKAEPSSDDSSRENAGGLGKTEIRGGKNQEFVSSTASDIRFSIDKDNRTSRRPRLSTARRKTSSADSLAGNA